MEKDGPVRWRDGAIVYCDVFRPHASGRVPAILNIRVYQKDKRWILPDNLEEKANEYFNWETANPLWWIPRGYAAVRIDSRGSGKSSGEANPLERDRDRHLSFAGTSCPRSRFPSE